MTVMTLRRAVCDRLTPEEVHIWCVTLDVSSEQRAEWAECLSPHERERAARFLRDSVREKFIVSHAALRQILSAYVSELPSEVPLTIRPDGKPELSSSASDPAIRFNLSHSGSRALIAVTLEREIGVDVEHVRPLGDAESLVRHFFAPREQQAWLALAEDERLACLFRIWTRKEAYLKARGLGLRHELDRFVVSSAAHEPARLLHSDDPADAGRNWQLRDVSPGDGYVAACAVDGPIALVREFNYAP